MKRIVYAGSELVTGDDIADALMDFGQALAEESTAENVEIPVIDGSGERAMASLLVGPASQIVALPAASPYPELVDEVAVQRLRARTAGLHHVVRAEEQDLGELPWTGDEV